MTVVDLTRHETRWRVYNRGGRLGQALTAGRPYEHQLLDEIYERHLSGMAIDVGASVGNHTLFLAAVCGLSVIAIEPDPLAHEMLLDNLALNPGLDVETFQVAAGRQQSMRYDCRGTLTSLHRVEPCVDGDVVIVAIDEILDEQCDVTLVKVDIEGHEADALDGARATLMRCHPLVYTEAHSRTAGRKIADVLEPLGYRHTGTLQMGSPMMRWEWSRR